MATPYRDSQGNTRFDIGEGDIMLLGAMLRANPFQSELPTTAPGAAAIATAQPLARIAPAREEIYIPDPEPAYIPDPEPMPAYAYHRRESVYIPDPEPRTTVTVDFTEEPYESPFYPDPEPKPSPKPAPTYTPPKLPIDLRGKALAKVGPAKNNKALAHMILGWPIKYAKKDPGVAIVAAFTFACLLLLAGVTLFGGSQTTAEKKSVPLASTPTSTPQ